MGVGGRKGRRGASEAGRRREEEDMWSNQRTGNYLDTGGQCVERAEGTYDEPRESLRLDHEGACTPC